VKLEQSQVCGPAGAHPVGVAVVAFRPGEDFGYTVAGDQRQLGVAAPCGAPVGVAGDSAAAVAGRVVEDVVDIPVDGVVGEQCPPDTGGACPDAGFGEVVGGGVNAIGVVVDVGAPSPSPSTPIEAQVPGMNCIRPFAPAELVWLLRPWPVSSMPMPASKVQGILYLPAAAMYSFLILFGMGSGGLCSESWRGRPGGGRGEPQAAFRRVAPMVNGVG
jgi:hypothetical protein